MRGEFLGYDVQVLSLDGIVQAIREYGLDNVYEVLERLFLSEPFVVINRDGKVIFFPSEEQEIYDFLELVNEKFNGNEEVEL
jgi:hypothetical protein